MEFAKLFGLKMIGFETPKPTTIGTFLQILSVEEDASLADSAEPEEAPPAVRPSSAGETSSAKLHDTRKNQDLGLRDGLRVNQLHTDRARELLKKQVRPWLSREGVSRTATAGIAPAANGSAEAAVKWIKSRVRTLCCLPVAHRQKCGQQQRNLL